MDFNELNLISSTNTKNSTIVGEKMLLLSLFVLSIQDLNLEPFFKGLTKYFIINKNPKIDHENIVGAMGYFFDETNEDYFLGFSNFCFVFGLNEDLLRALIRGHIIKRDDKIYQELVVWETIHEQ